MTRSIVIKLYSGETEVDSLTTTIKDYCNTILSNSEYSDSHELMKAVVTFGRHNQEYFNVDKTNLADSILSTPIDLSTLNLNLDYYKQYKYKVRLDEISGLSFTSSVDFAAVPKIAIYYELENGLNIGDFTFTHEGKTLTATEGSDAYGTYYLVTIPFNYSNIINEERIIVTKDNQIETDIMAPVGYALAMIQKRGFTGMGAVNASMIYYYQEANNYYY